MGESSGWPRVIETAIHDLKPLLLGEDPFLIERLWHKMMASMMGHGMLGVVGHGALTGIEMALWDIKGKALGVPVAKALVQTLPPPVAPDGLAASCATPTARPA